ncbi:hypothetical protein HZY86_01895 [Aerococcaceae bacterium DSM 111020]|nr:hypothetical protein [Aerococcaceae bacterium DSM 111020]
MSKKASKNTRKKNVRKTAEDATGRNTHFKDGNKTMTRAQFVKDIKAGKYLGYTVKRINGKDTPVSKPDKSSKNNLE